MLEAVTILGCGRTARAMCAYLMERGVQVLLWSRSEETAKEIAAHGVRVTGCCEGEYHPMATADIAVAMRHSRYVFVMTTSNGHLPVARQLHGLLRGGQRLLIFNGNWGAYEFYAELRRELEEQDVTVAETGAMIFLVDYRDGAVHIKKIKDSISVASLPRRETLPLLAELAETLPQLTPEDNIACTSLNSSNPVIHAPITLFNFTRVENGEDFFFYGGAASRSVIGYIEKIDAERCRVAQAVGASPRSCLEIINSFWPDKHATLYDAIKENAAYQTGKGPVTLNYRYVNEDIPFGIAPIAALGRRYGVPTPYIDALLVCYEGLLSAPVTAPDFDRADLRALCADSGKATE